MSKSRSWLLLVIAGLPAFSGCLSDWTYPRHSPSAQGEFHHLFHLEVRGQYGKEPLVILLSLDGVQPDDNHLLVEGVTLATANSTSQGEDHPSRAIERSAEADGHFILVAEFESLSDLGIKMADGFDPVVREHKPLSSIPKEFRTSPRHLVRLAAYLQPDPQDAPAIVPVLRQTLRDPVPRERRLAAAGLGHFGAAVAETVPDLMEALADRDAIVRLYAAQALWQIQGGADSALPTLIEGLKSEQRHVPDLAALFLGRMGPAAAPAVPALSEALWHKNEYVRAQAMFALGKIGPAAKAAALVLREALDDPDNAETVNVKNTTRSVRSYAIVALREIGQKESRSDGR